jgi:hypothetical protein
LGTFIAIGPFRWFDARGGIWLAKAGDGHGIRVRETIGSVPP